MASENWDPNMCRSHRSRLCLLAFYEVLSQFKNSQVFRFQVNPFGWKFLLLRGEGLGG